MEENSQATSGAESTASGVDNENEAPSSTSGEPGANGYPSHFVEKVKKEKDNYAKQAADLKAKLAELEAKLNSSAEQKLAEKEQYKTLWEQEKTRRTELEQFVQKTKAEKVESTKRDAVKKHLFDLGLRPEKEDVVFRLMDLSNVMVDDETLAVIGAEEAAKALYEKHNDLGIFKHASPKVSHQAAPSRQVGLETEKPKISSKEELIAQLKQLHGG